MAVTIPESYRDLFAKRAFAHLGTVMADGSPQVTPVWCDLDGSYIRIDTAKGRVSFPPLVGQFLTSNKLVNRSPEICAPWLFLSDRGI